VTATYIGQKILTALRGRGPTTRAWRLLALLLALVALWLLGRVPYVGDWIKFLALIVGMGALVMAAWSGRGPRSTQATA
jgi:Flp pilus assembly pilin Flp